MGDMAAFAGRMRAKANRVDQAVADAMKQVAIAVVSDVAPATPIKSGQAQANWLVFVGNPSPFYSANANSNGGWRESVANAQARLANYHGGDIHIVNNVPYIAELNRGSSRQAPALFVQSAVLRAQYRFKGIRIKL